MGFLAIPGSPSVKCLFTSFAHILIRLLLLKYQNYLYILGASPLSDVFFTDILFQSVGCLFIFLMASFEAQKVDC